MARIAGVDLPREKRVEIALTYIYGIGRPTSSRILAETGVSPDTRVRDLSDAEVARLRQIIERSVKVEGALRTEVAMNIKRLMDIGSYRGHPPPPGPAGARPAHPHQRPDQEGSAAGHRRQEEGDQEVTMTALLRSRAAKAPGRQARQEGRRVRGHRPHLGDVQQPADHDHRHEGQHPRVGIGGQGGLQGLQEVHAVRRHRRRRELRPRGDEPRACAGCTCGCRARAAAASRPSRRSPRSGSRSCPSATSRRFRTTAAVRPRSGGSEPCHDTPVPSCRLCRREGTKLFLKGTRCLTEKCAVERRGYAPGQHGQSGGRAPQGVGVRQAAA